MQRISKFISLCLAVFILCSVVKLPSVKAFGDDNTNLLLDSRIENAIVMSIGSPTAIVNNEMKTIDSKSTETKPVIINDRALVPVSFIAENLSSQVTWDGASSIVTITQEGKTIKLKIGSNVMSVNGQDIPLEVPAAIINSRTFVPLRAVTDAFEDKLFYDRGIIVISGSEKLFDMALAEDRAMVEILIFKFEDENTKAVYEKVKNNIVMQLGKPSAYVNGKTTLIDKENKEIIPAIKNDRALVPLRFIAESLESLISWDAETATVSLMLYGKFIKIKIGTNEMKVDQNVILLDSPATIIGDKTFVPLRAIAEAFDKKVYYNNGLIVIGDNDKVFDESNEIAMVGELTTWFEEPPRITIPSEFEVKARITEKDIDILEDSVVIVQSLDEKGNVLSNGSAFCIADGLFLTNLHVIAGSSSFKVKTSDNESVPMEGVVKYDADLNLAILKSAGENGIQPLKLGNKDMLKKGDRIVTIGSIKGEYNNIFDGSVTELHNVENFDFIQITAPIYRGNSGGALFTMQGEVVGINTFAIVYEDGSKVFLSLAIDHALVWINELKNKPLKDIPVVDLWKTPSQAGIY